METTSNAHDIRQHVGENIRLMRESQGLSQYKFSAMIGMDRTYLIGVEKGRRNVSLDNLSKIAAGLDIPISHLFADVERDI